MVAPVLVSSSALPAVAIVALESMLREELGAQRDQVADHEATVHELTGSSDPDSVFARDIAERAMNHALGVIAEIEHALDRISTATYGTCEHCGGAIASARLEALPYARTCVSCPPAAPLPRRD